MRRSFLKVFGLALAVSVLPGCTTLFVSGDDSQCARDLAEVENAAAAARRALAEGVSALLLPARKRFGTRGLERVDKNQGMTSTVKAVESARRG